MTARWTEHSILREVASAARHVVAEPKSAERRAKLAQWLAALALWDEDHAAPPAAPAPVPLLEHRREEAAE